MGEEARHGRRVGKPKQLMEEMKLMPARAGLSLEPPARLSHRDTREVMPKPARLRTPHGRDHALHERGQRHAAGDAQVAQRYHGHHVPAVDEAVGQHATGHHAADAGGAARTRVLPAGRDHPGEADGIPVVHGTPGGHAARGDAVRHEEEGRGFQSVSPCFLRKVHAHHVTLAGHDGLLLGPDNDDGRVWPRSAPAPAHQSGPGRRP